MFVLKHWGQKKNEEEKNATCGELYKTPNDKLHLPFTDIYKKKLAWLRRPYYKAIISLPNKEHTKVKKK